MTRKNSHQPLLNLALSVGLAILPHLQTPVQAQSTSEIKTPTIAFTPPPGKPGAPRSSAGGGTRGNCSSSLNHNSITPDSPPLTLLTPVKSQNHPQLTSLDYPTFLIYIPPTHAEVAEFTLVDQKEEYSYQTTFSLKQTSGIIRFQLPAEAPPLEPGKTYTWKVAIVCDRESRTEDVVAQEQIQYTPLQPAQVSQLETATPLERVALLGEMGIWFELVETLADLQQSQPDNLTLATAWKELLQSQTVGLNDIAQAPLISCCTVED